MKKTPRCPLCNNRLYTRKCGFVCKNWKCLLYSKGSGWCLKDSNWVYTDRFIDGVIAWDKAHPNVVYPPIKKEIPERHLESMNATLCKNGDLVFVIPLKYYSPDSEEVPE